jgi:Caspase domain
MMEAHGGRKEGHGGLVGRTVCWFAAATCWAFLTALANPAEARRVALVIGNAQYGSGVLHTPVGDAEAVAKVFKRALGFDRVILRQNLDYNGFLRALEELARSASGADVGVVYFAGHGTEADGRNFLLPVDARLHGFPLEAIPLDTVLQRLDDVKTLKLVILDASRSNSFVLSGGKRTVERGLAAVAPANGMLTVYAAEAGTTADDVDGHPHSPFTEALLKHIATPELEIRDLLDQVGDDVAAATDDRQRPHVYGALDDKEYFLYQPKDPATPASAHKPAGSGSDDNPPTEEHAASTAAVEVLPESEQPAPTDLARQLQVELRRVGCDPGPIDGKWGERAETALERFAQRAKLSLTTDEPTLAALDAVKAQTSPICPAPVRRRVRSRSSPSPSFGFPIPIPFPPTNL